MSRLRLVPLLARSVGLGPVPFPPQGRFGHRPIHRLPFPVDAHGSIVLQEPSLPQFLKAPGLLPLLEAIVCGAPRPQTPRQGLPLTTGAQHIEDGVQGLAVIHAGPSAFGFRLRFGQHFLEVGPEGVRSPPVGINRGIVFLFHIQYLQHRTRYSDRLLAAFADFCLLTREALNVIQRGGD